VTIERPDHRTVTLVVADEEGVLGQLEPFEVSTPWWPDVLPIVTAHPGLAVLRLLEATPAPGSRIGGVVTYLAQRLPSSLALASSAPLRLLPWHGVEHDDPLRLPWASPGGPIADLEWADVQVVRTGAPTQHRTWNLSAIWSLPTAAGDAWLKCVPPFSEHETPILQLLAGQPVPTLLGASGHRQLLAALPGENAFDATFEERCVLIDVLIEIQRANQGKVDALLADGVPDRRWPVFGRAARAVVERRRPSDPVLRELVTTLEVRAAAIDDCGLPDVLVHGDAHGGNARVGPGTGRGIWFDWSDARIGSPLLDVAVLERPGTEDADALRDYWLDAWARAVPGSDPHRAWALVRPLAAIGDAIVYQGFLDEIEASERIYHDEDVLPALDRAAEWAAGRPRYMT
jgi:Phosphotransferase enzyme family